MEWRPFYKDTMRFFEGFFRQTERLILKEATTEDATILAKKRSTPFVMRYNLYEPCGEAQIAGELADNPHVLLKNRATGEIIGAISLRDDDFRYHIAAKEMAAWLTEEYAAQGLMSEAIPPVMDHIFNRDIERISIRIFAENKPSIRLAEKLGFVREGYLARAVKNKQGEVFDVALYSLDANNYLKK